ncbi:MAG: FeoA family protein [Pseudomonadota bacterium]
MMHEKKTSQQSVPNASHLGLLKKGEYGIITRVHDSSSIAGASAIQLRLLELGFIKGESVRILAESFPTGDPIAVRVGSSTFALRRHEASMVEVALMNA